MIKKSNLSRPVTTLSEPERRIRLILDTLIFNAEAGQAALLRLSRDLETVCGRKPTIAGADVSHDELTAMFTDAWTAVRSCHSVFQILRKQSKGLEIEITEQHLKLGETVTKLRNEIDHSIEKLGNYAKTKKAMPPLLGFLTAAFSDRHRGEPSSEVASVIVLSHSDFHHRVDLDAVGNVEFSASGVIENVRLHAFEYVAELSQVEEFLNFLLPLLRRKYAGPTERLNVILQVRAQTSPSSK